MPYIKTKNWGAIKPPVGSQINWGHPLSRGMVACYVFNAGGGLRDINLASPTSIGGYSSLVNGAYFNKEGVTLDGSDDYIESRLLYNTGNTTGDASVRVMQPSNKFAVCLWAKPRISQVKSPFGNCDTSDKNTCDIFKTHQMFFGRE